MKQHIVSALKQSLLIAFAVSFIGCAQLSPQQVTFTPSIPTDNLIQAEGSASLTVMDKRKDNIIGYRGGSYAETSTIQSKHPLDEVIEAIALQVLEKTVYQGSRINQQRPPLYRQ